jgi:Holliday junction resolvase-like predicted endonuclease
MTHAALQFIADGEGFGKPVRFDVVEITADGIRHVRNAFQCSGW